MRRTAAVMAVILGTGAACAWAQEEPKFDTTNIVAVVQFGHDSVDLDRPSRRALDAAVAKLNEAGGPIEVGGHTDNVGPEEYNRALAQRRAEVVKAYLAKRGVEASRMTTIAYAAHEPRNRNETRAARFLNRRVHVRLGGRG